MSDLWGRSWHNRAKGLGKNGDKAKAKSAELKHVQRMAMPLQRRLLLALLLRKQPLPMYHRRVRSLGMVREYLITSHTSFY